MGSYRKNNNQFASKYRNLWKELSKQTVNAYTTQLPTSTKIKEKLVLKANKSNIQSKLKIQKQVIKRMCPNYIYFARKHITWSKEQHYVVFSDEKKFNFESPYGYSFYFQGLRKEDYHLDFSHSRVGGVVVSPHPYPNKQPENCSF